MQQHAGRVFSRAVVLSLGSVSQFQGLCESVPGVRCVSSMGLCEIHGFYFVY